MPLLALGSYCFVFSTAFTLSCVYFQPCRPIKLRGCDYFVPAEWADDINYVVVYIFQLNVADVYFVCRNVSDCHPNRGDVVKISSGRDSSRGVTIL